MATATTNRKLDTMAQNNEIWRRKTKTYILYIVKHLFCILQWNNLTMAHNYPTKVSNNDHVYSLWIGAFLLLLSSLYGMCVLCFYVCVCKDVYSIMGFWCFSSFFAFRSFYFFFIEISFHYFDAVLLCM